MSIKSVRICNNAIETLQLTVNPDPDNILSLPLNDKNIY